MCACGMKCGSHKRSGEPKDCQEKTLTSVKIINKDERAYCFLLTFFGKKRDMKPKRVQRGGMRSKEEMMRWT